MEQVMTDLADIRLNSPETSQDVFPLYEKLRADGGVTWSRRHKAWLVSDYASARATLTHPGVSVEKLSPFAAHAMGDIKEQMLEMQRVMGNWLPFLDPPAHTRIRRFLQRGFMPRAVEAHEPLIRKATRQALDAISGRDEIEFLKDFAAHIPAVTITDLFGLPETEVGRIKAWSAGIAQFVLGSANPDRYANSLTMMREMQAYFVDIVTRRNSAIEAGEPEGPGALMNLLLQARREPEGLTDEEIVSTLVLILFAAPETTAYMFLNAMMSLVMNRPQLERLQADPGRIAPALEELIRYDGPVPAVVRVAKTAMDLGGQTIAAGDRIFILLKSANRDEHQFRSAAELDFDRGPCPHLGFGIGIHMCLGAPLARLEARIAFEEFLAHYSQIELAEQEIVWRDELIAHSPKALRLKLTAAAR
jgi:cytochrome P450